MMRSGGQTREVEITVADFEGLVCSTSRMFAKQVRREEDDLAQELRIVVARAIEKYNPARSTLPIRNYVYGAVANKMKDYKRDAAREVARREKHGISFVAIEETRCSADQSAAERFDALHHNVGPEQVYGGVDDLFAMPSTVTERECDIALLLMMEMTKTEIVVRLGVARVEVDAAIVSLRIKLSDWAPATRQQAPTTELKSDPSTAPAVSSEPTRSAQLVGSRAA